MQRHFILFLGSFTKAFPEKNYPLCEIYGNRCFESFVRARHDKRKANECTQACQKDCEKVEYSIKWVAEHKGK